jgi:hypothetical protein
MALVLGLVAFSLAYPAARAAAAGYEEGQTVTLVVPLTACQKVERRNAQQQGTAYEVDVTIDSQGGLVLGGDPNWRARSLPLIVAGQVTSITRSKRTKQTILAFDGDGTTVDLRVPIDAAWQQPMEEVLVPGHSSLAEPSAALTASLEGMIEAYCKEPFGAPLDTLEPRIRRRVAEVQLAVGDLEPPSTSTFEDEVYFDARLGEGAAVYNKTSGTESQRVTNTITDRVLPAVKAWARVFFGAVPFAGFRVAATITTKDFTEYPPQPQHDELELYVPLKEANRYAVDDVSAAALVGASVVLLNGKPYRPELANPTSR